MKVTITGTVRVMQYCSTELDFHDEYCDMLPWYSVKKIEIDGKEVYNLPTVKQKAYRAMMAHMQKPWCIRRGQLVDNYTRTYDVPGDDQNALQMVLSTDFAWLMNARLSEYIMYNGQKVEATEQNEEIIEGDYDEFVVKK